MDHILGQVSVQSKTIYGHDYIHMWCCPHILNLVVQEGLKDTDGSILKV
jgi:hypothetical protein